MEIVLVSNSPRRRQLVSYFGLPVRCVSPSDIEEKVRARTFDEARRIVVENARDKVVSVKGEYFDSLIIGADTLVFANGRSFPKPRDKREAVEFLKILSRNPHWVFTGVYLSWKDKDIYGVGETRVYMDPIDENEIVRYIEKEDPLDKAGGFGIQGFAGAFIHRIEGCFYNVMGFPLALVRRLLLELTGAQRISDLVSAG